MVQYVPVEFLSDQEAAAFGRYGGSVPRADLERFFYLDDTDRKLVHGCRSWNGGGPGRRGRRARKWSRR
jgi:hypothetical protein